MSVAFLVLAHRDPMQVGRLARRLLGALTSVHVHVDLRATPDTHRDILAALPKSASVRLVPRVASRWASWGVVEAMLTGLRSVLDSRLSADHIAILSAQCYPLQPSEKLVRFFASALGHSFVDAWPMPSALWGPEGGMHRLLQWHMPILGRRFRIPVRRGYPPGLHPYAGQTWMVLDRETARQLLEFTDAHPEIVRFHRHVWIPDEHYIQTVLHNCARKEALVKLNLWYTEWQPSDKHPRVFIESDYPRLAEAAARRSDTTEALFARKFDPNRAPKILDIIDERLLGANTAPGATC
jgi:hypothetical protein